MSTRAAVGRTAGAPGGSPVLDPPPEVVELVERLERAGFETWCVGGAVRDAVLGHPHLDWDLATAATPTDVQRVFRRTVPLGVEFGTVGVFDSRKVMHEVTTFRRDVETDGRHAVVRFGVSLDDDLSRRDFTINALAYSPTRRELRDPFGGRADLERGVLRTVGDPDARMSEDRLRALRALRFAARFGFEIDPPTWDAITRSAPHLTRLSAERVRQELEKTMEQVARPSTALLRWRSSGALGVLIPALASVEEWRLTIPDYLAVPGLPRRPQRRSTRIAALYSSLEPRTVDAGLRALRFSKIETSWITSLVERWQSLRAPMAEALQTGPPPTPAAIRRWVALAGRTRVPAVFRLAGATWCAERAADRPAPSPDGLAPIYRRAVRAAFHDPIEIGDLAMDGDDLRAAGFAAGPTLGRLLNALLDAVLEDPRRNTPTELLGLAREMARGAPSGSDTSRGPRPSGTA